MSSRSKPVTVQILEKEYLVACKEGERDELLASAELLNSKMQQIRDSGKVIGADRIAVMAALNLAHDLVQDHGQEFEYQQTISSRIRNLQEKVETALVSGNQLEF